MKGSNWIVKRLRDVIPVVQDSPREWARKIAFWMALMVFLCASFFLADELYWQPEQTKQTANTLRNWYHSDTVDDGLNDDGTPDTTVYPEGIDPAFKRLYRANSDVRGWITFTCGSGSGDVFEGTVDNPVVQTTDNDYYLNRDFWGASDKAGTLFFDYRNDLGPASEDRNRIIYGHNLTSGLMFSKFNKLATGNLDYGKRLSTLTLDTLYEKNTYKVIAVMVLNVESSDGPVFNYLRTRFSGEADFMDFVEEVRRRSLFDFPVDVQEGDQLLTLSTCSNKRETTLKDGRVVIVARRVREGEDPSVDTTQTVKNEDVLMPKAWYINKGLSLPSEYQDDPATPGTTTNAGNSTTPSGSVTTIKPGDDPTTKPGDDPTTKPSDNPVTKPSDNPTTVPGDDPTTTPSGGDSTTSTSEGDGTTVPSDSETTTSSEGDGTTTSSDGEETTTTSSEDGETTTSSDGEETTTTSSEGEETTTSSDTEETTTTEPQTEPTEPSTEPSEESPAE